jgi:hypothetical protein
MMSPTAQPVVAISQNIYCNFSHTINPATTLRFSTHYPPSELLNPPVYAFYITPDRELTYSYNQPFSRNIVLCVLAESKNKKA